MRYHHQSLLLLPHHLLHQIHHFHGSVGIQIPGRFVREDDLRFHHQRPGHAYTLLLTAGHLVGPVFLMLFKSDQLQHFLRLPDAALPVHPLKRKRKRHVLDGIHSPHQVKRLKDKTDMLPAKRHQLVLRLPLHMLSGDHDLALRGLLQARQHIEERGFTGTGCTYDGTEIPPVNGEADAVQRAHFRLTDPIDLI